MGKSRSGLAAAREIAKSGLQPLLNEFEPAKLKESGLGTYTVLIGGITMIATMYPDRRPHAQLTECEFEIGFIEDQLTIKGVYNATRNKFRIPLDSLPSIPGDRVDQLKSVAKAAQSTREALWEWGKGLKAS